MTDDRGTWHSTTSGRTAAIVTAAAHTARLLRAARAAYLTEPKPVSFWSGAPLPEYEATVVKAGPDPRFLAQQQRLSQIADDSKLLDSRIEYWSWYTGVTPEVRRVALQHGYTVRFRVFRNGRRVTLHTICPDEVR